MSETINSEKTCELSGKSGENIQLSTISQLDWERADYVFYGWGTERDSRTMEVADGGTVNYPTNKDLYAIWFPKDYLCFTAQENDTEIQLYQTFGQSIATKKLVYSNDNMKTWNPLNWDNGYSDKIILSKGQKLYLKTNNISTGANTLSESTQNVVRMETISGQVKISGNIMSLVDGSLKQTTVPTYCFYHFFEGFSNILTAPKLPATTLNTNCYEGMFQKCTGLWEAPELPATTLKSGCYNNMFYGCKQLSSMNVKFTTWTDGCTLNWLNGVSESGTFKCPEDLAEPESRSGSTVPSSWNIDK